LNKVLWLCLYNNYFLVEKAMYIYLSQYISFFCLFAILPCDVIFFVTFFFVYIVPPSLYNDNISNFDGEKKEKLHKIDIYNIHIKCKISTPICINKACIPPKFSISNLHQENYIIYYGKSKTEGEKTTSKLLTTSLLVY